MEMYEIGGCVRDEILGVSSKDIDFSIVLSDDDVALSAVGPFETMVARLNQMGFKIFLETPEHLTVRAQVPKNHKIFECQPNGKTLTADFVLARKEGTYSDGRRPDSVEPGTLEDDIRRRDFTMNALAKASNGTIIDMVGGVQDINDRVIRAVGNPLDRLNEDALRAVRALRFSVTKGFRIDKELEFAMQVVSVLDAIEDKISDERIADELSKMFRFDTVASLTALNRFPALTRAMFSGRVSLDSTMKQKGRGK